MYKIVLTGGGTGGHVLPNVAIIEEMLSRGYEVFYIGSRDGMEKDIIPKLGVPYYDTDTVKLSRSEPLKNIKIPYLLPKGITEAKKILKALTPDAVFSKGGFVSLPTAYAAHFLKIPVITHESDASLGMANKLVSSFAKLLIATNPNISAKCKTVVYNNPLRKKIFAGNALKVFENARFDASKPVLLVVGGSSGAKKINDFVILNLDALTKKYNVLHITGKSADSVSAEGYKSTQFVSDIENYYAAADYVISRAGANAAEELMALNKKVLFVPLSKVASRGDQILNARKLEEQGFARALEEEYLTLDNVINELNALRDMPRNSYRYDNDTPKKIVDEIVNVIKENRSQAER